MSKLGALCLAFALALHAPFAHAQPELSAAQVRAALARGEKLLAAGQSAKAFAAMEPLSGALMLNADAYERFFELWSRMLLVHCTAVVRLRGQVKTHTQPPVAPESLMHDAELRLSELADPKLLDKAGVSKPDAKALGFSDAGPPPLWIARYGEALAAAQKHQQAYQLLQPLLSNMTLTEPEAAAALAISAKATGHVDTAEAARTLCVKLAKKRAPALCPRA